MDFQVKVLWPCWGLLFLDDLVHTLCKCSNTVHILKSRFLALHLIGHLEICLLILLVFLLLICTLLILGHSICKDSCLICLSSNFDTTDYICEAFWLFTSVVKLIKLDWAIDRSRDELIVLRLMSFGLVRHFIDLMGDHLFEIIIVSLLSLELFMDDLESI